MSPHGHEAIRELLGVHALRALPADEVATVAAHVAGCGDCAEELRQLRATVDGFADWPTDVLRPSRCLWDGIAARIAADAGGVPAASPPARMATALEPAWQQAGPGIAYRLLSTDSIHHRVGMLVRLAPGAAYPPHRHAGVEELFLLHGELWIENRKLLPGDYNRAEPGTADRRVWSATGCTCLLITSTEDVLG